MCYNTPMYFTPKEEKNIRLYFYTSIIIKGLISLAEIIAGIILFFVPVSFFANLALRLAQAELLEEPNDFIATHLTSVLHHLPAVSGAFIALYILSRGLIKVGLIAGLLKNKLWAYPSSLVVLGAFVAYQLYQLYTAFSGFIIALTIFDLIVMWSIWEEYKVVKFEAERRGQKL